MLLVITETAAIAASVARALNAQSTPNPSVFSGAKATVAVIPAGFITPYAVGGAPGPEALPLVPEKYSYGIRLTEVDGKRMVSPEDAAYADFLGDIFKSAEEVVFASDGGADAQARFGNICRYFKVGTRTSRMWATRLELKALRSAFKKRQTGRDLHRLAQTGQSGMAMNELFAYNVTEAYRALFPDMKTTIGRQDLIVISAAKAMNDKAQEMLADHNPKAVHSVCVSGKVLGNDVKFYPSEVWDDKAECLKAYEGLRMPATVTAEYCDVSVEASDASELFVLTTL